MKRYVLVAVVALLAFYVAWPAWTGQQILSAIRTEDAALLERKIDFPSVRAALRPLIEAEVSRALDRLQRDAGALGAVLGGPLRGNAAGIAESIAAAVVTPANLIRIVKQGRTLKEAIEILMGEQLGRSGRSTGGAPGPRPGTEPSRTTPSLPGEAETTPRLGLANIKGIKIEGPLSFSVALARDPAAADSDLTAGLAFTRFDWKVVSLLPRVAR